MHEHYFSPRQLHKLEQRKKALGERFFEKNRKQWKLIWQALKKLQDNNEPPTSNAAQKLAKKARILIDIVTEKEPEIEKSFYTMYKTEAGLHLMQQKGFDVDDALYTYLNKAMDVAKENNDDTTQLGL